MVNEMSDQEVRCPMCGKPNPADAEVCRYCHARLKPLRLDETPKPQSTAELKKTLPPWMQRLENQQTAAESPDTGSLDLTSAPQEKATAETTPPAPAADPLWDEESTEEQGLPEWLQSLGSEGGLLSSTEKPEAEISAEPEEEDWLSSIANATADDLPEEPEETAIFPSAEEAAPAREEGGASTSSDNADNLMNWLDEVVSENEPPAEPAAEGELPDWLAAEMPEGAAAEPQPASEDDWLSETAPAEPAAEPLPEPAAEGELPDWLAAEMTEGAAAEPQPAPEAKEEAPSEPVPDWLSAATEEPEKASTPSPFVDAALTEEILGETPDWLKILTPETADELGESAPEPDTEAAGEEAAPLISGEMPAWVEAMRPVVGSFAGDEEESAVETQGPLAGLRGALPSPEPTFLRPGRLSGVGGRLILNDRQEEQTKILQTMLSGEFAPRPPAAQRRTIPRQQVLRWLLGILLLLAAIAPIAMPNLQLPLPHKILPSALAAQKIINTIQPGAPVLVAVDYTPAFAGEMESVAAPVLGDLLAHGALLALVSTRPTGPDLAQHLMETALPPDAQDASRYLNLGYLPGSTAGLYTFAQAPRLLFSQRWQTPMLAHVQHLSDFAMVMVITEDDETARAWLEQVRPALDTDTPMVMVISTQAEPMVEPYYETNPRQAAGLVTGIEGGLAYALVSGRPITTTSTMQWSSYGYIALTGVLLMIATGLYNLALGLKEARSRRSSHDEDEIEDETEDMATEEEEEA